MRVVVYSGGLMGDWTIVGLKKKCAFMYNYSITLYIVIVIVNS